MRFCVGGSLKPLGICSADYCDFIIDLSQGNEDKQLFKLALCPKCNSPVVCLCPGCGFAMRGSLSSRVIRCDVCRRLIRDFCNLRKPRLAASPQMLLLAAREELDEL